MATNRLEILLSMVEKNPQDSFARYGLAMEYANTGDLERAIAEYRALIGFNPDYAAAYFHGGHALEKLGRIDEAREVYQKGIEATARTGDAHTRSELQAALDMVPLSRGRRRGLFPVTREHRIHVYILILAIQ
jgi:tetratricopeptide (TPR) repeat protein